MLGRLEEFGKQYNFFAVAPLLAFLFAVAFASRASAQSNDAATETRAEVITGFNGERGGVPAPGCRFVDTPHGRGLRLYQPPGGVMEK